MSINWKDITSYSQSDTERVPRTYEVVVPKVGRIIVTRWRDGEPDFWYLTCHELNIKYHPLKGFKLENAQDEAIHFVYRRLLDMTQAMEDFCK